MNAMEQKPVGVKFEALEPEKNEKIFNKQGDWYQSERTRKGGREEGGRDGRRKREKKNMKRAGEWEQIKERDGEGMERLDEKKCYER